MTNESKVKHILLILQTNQLFVYRKRFGAVYVFHNPPTHKRVVYIRQKKHKYLFRNFKRLVLC